MALSCPSCNAQLGSDDKYCWECGAKIGKQPPRSNAIGATVLAAVLVLLLAGAGFYYSQQLEREQRARQEERRLAAERTQLQAEEERRRAQAEREQEERKQRLADELTRYVGTVTAADWAYLAQLGLELEKPDPGDGSPGVAIVGVKEGSPAATKGLQGGRRILRVDSIKVRRDVDVVASVRRAREMNRGAVRFLMERTRADDGAKEYYLLALPLPSPQSTTNPRLPPSVERLPDDNPLRKWFENLPDAR